MATSQNANGATLKERKTCAGCLLCTGIGSWRPGDAPKTGTSIWRRVERSRAKGPGRA